MFEERSQQLFSALEARAADALAELQVFRAKVQELETRLAESEAARLELDAARLELTEENRELDEQNRELEEDNARLRERLRKGESAPSFLGPSRRTQGLAALMGQRGREPATEQGASQTVVTPAEVKPQAAQPEAAALSQSPAAAVAAQESTLPPTAKPGDLPPASEAEVGAEVKAHSADKPATQAPTAEALLKQWYERYPHTFFKGHTRPLKVGIHHELTAREPWPEKLVRRALAGYVNLPRYLKAVREGAERIDLDGAAAGSVDAEAAEHAKRKLERLQSERRERSRKQGGSPGRNDGQDSAREGKAKRSPRRDAAKSKRGRGEQGPRQAARGKPAPQAAEAQSTVPAAQAADPQARLEAKLSALLAKHNGRDANGHG